MISVMFFTSNCYYILLSFLIFIAAKIAYIDISVYCNYWGNIFYEVPSCVVQYTEVLLMTSSACSSDTSPLEVQGNFV